MFGSMILKEFYVALNSTQGQIGLAPLRAVVR